MIQRLFVLALPSLIAGLGGACGDNGAAPFDGSVTPVADADSTPLVYDAYIADAVEATCTPVGGSTAKLELVASAGDSVVLVTAPTGDARQFIVEQDGIIRTMRDGVLADAPYLDITDSSGGPVLAGGERGLLGLAFHPDFAHNQRFFVYYTTATQDVIAEYRGTAVDHADPATGKVLLAIPDFASNHNGGMMQFGPDGLLYIGTGDGGGADDPQHTGQDVDRLLGKILRIDVDAQAEGLGYGIPLSNPFASGGGAPEILALGMRNPWRWSFDGADIFIGDVGQDEIEELDIVPIADLPGANFGWSQYEASACFDPPCDPAGKIFPVDELTHDDGACSIIGGAVYRGSCAPDLSGRYFYTDYCDTTLRWLTWDGAAITDSGGSEGKPSPASIHTDALGEIWVSNTEGKIYRLIGTP